MEDFESFSVDDYQTLLQMLNINLPRGALTAEVCERSTHTDLLNDSRALIRELKSSKLTVVGKPRLSCVDIKHAHDLKERGEILTIVRLLFFQENTDPKKTLRKRWEKYASRRGFGFRMRDTYTETPISIPLTPELSAGAGRQGFGNPVDNQKNAEDCFKFFLQMNGLDKEVVPANKERTAESGFISGRMDFLLDIKNPGESSETSLREKVILECKGTEGNMVGDVFTLPPDGGHQAEFNKSHKYYHQTQAYLYLLEKELHSVPVRAVMVVKVSDDTDPRFYWAEVSDNTENMERLNQCFQEEVLPRFLAVLNLIFQKVE